jgi:hypothetical protein
MNDRRRLRDLGVPVPAAGAGAGVGGGIRIGVIRRVVVAEVGVGVPGVGVRGGGVGGHVVVLGLVVVGRRQREHGRPRRRGGVVVARKLRQRVGNARERAKVGGVRGRELRAPQVPALPAERRRRGHVRRVQTRAPAPHPPRSPAAH